MRKFIVTGIFAAAIGLTTCVPRNVVADEMTIKEKHTTVSPSGRLVIENQQSRTFKLEGQTQVYTAPADVDLSTYSNKDVTVNVGPDGKVTRIERKTTTMP